MSADAKDNHFPRWLWRPWCVAGPLTRLRVTPWIPNSRSRRATPRAARPLGLRAATRALTLIGQATGLEAQPLAREARRMVGAAHPAETDSAILTPSSIAVAKAPYAR